MIKYNFTEEEINKCKEFAEKIDTSFYAKRNQFNNEKRKKDQLVGKLGEIISYNYLKPKINNLSYPDFNIYDKKDKSWDFDMKGDNYNIHVKSQEVSQGIRYGESWIFQKGSKNKGYDKEIFDKISPNQYICFCSIDLNKNCGEIKSVVNLNFLHDKNLFKEPKLAKLAELNKVAVYCLDLGIKFDI